jgi:hypothetical protein
VIELGERYTGEEDFELSAGVRGNPVRLLARGRLEAEVDVHRTIGVLLQVRILRGAAGPRLIAD